MPLRKGRSGKIRRENFLELISSPAGKIRQKAIKTIMRRRKVSYEKAKQIQAGAISRSYARKKV